MSKKAKKFTAFITALTLISILVFPAYADSARSPLFSQISLTIALEPSASPEPSPDVSSMPEPNPDVSLSPEPSPDVSSAPEPSPDVSSMPEPSPDVSSSPSTAPTLEPEQSFEPLETGVFELPHKMFSEYGKGEWRQIAAPRQNGVYFLSGNTLYFYSLSDKNAEPEAAHKFDGAIVDSFVNNGKLYVLAYTYDYYDAKAQYNNKVCVYNLDDKIYEGDVALEFTDLIDGALGVDNDGKIYIAFNYFNYDYYSESLPVMLFFESGEFLSQTDRYNDIQSFVGFDGGAGDFYYSAYKERDDLPSPGRMFSLYRGNRTDNDITVENDAFQDIYHKGVELYNDSSEIVGGKYLCVDTMLTGCEGKYTSPRESGLIVYDISGSESSQPINIDRTYQNYGIVGSRTVYNEKTGSIITVKGDGQCLAEIEPSTVKVIYETETAYPVYSLGKLGDYVYAIERKGTGYYAGYCIEVIAWSIPTDVKINGASEIAVGESMELSVTDDGSFSDHSWNSSDPSILSVNDNGEVFAWKEGEAVITVTAVGGLTADKLIKVKPNPKIGIPAEEPVFLSGEETSNISKNDYTTRAAPINSYLEENADGTYTRVEYKQNSEYLTIENFNNSGELLDSRSIELELPKFGGYYRGGDYNYLVFGKDNPEESEDAEIMRVVKYTSDWKRAAEASVYGANTVEPFRSGSVRMTETDNKLYIHTCHSMFMSDDGLNHQANMSFVVDEDDMTIVSRCYSVSNFRSGYVSHSFNQFIQTDGEYIYRVDHGDAYPRGISLTRCPVGGAISDGITYCVPFLIEGETGDNYTGASVGGFELSSDKCITAGNSIAEGDYYKENNYYNEQRNIFITVTDKNLKSSETKWITSYTDGNITVKTPYLIKLGVDQFLLMWEERSGSDGGSLTKLLCLDGRGNPVGDIRQTTLPLSDCRPIVCKDKLVRWYCGNDGAPVLCELNPYDLDSAYSDAPFVSTAYMSGDKLTVNTYLFNRINECQYIIAAYSGDELISIKTDLIYGTKNNLTKNITCVKKPDKVKIMMWDNMDNIAPMYEPQTVAIN